MEIVSIAGVIVLFLWAAGLSGRLSKLEQREREALKAAGPPMVPRPVAEPVAPVLPEEAPGPRMSQEEVATNWLTRIGILALLFGIGFFLKYAIDREWISVWTRIIMGLSSGVLLIVLGEMWKNKYEKYAAALTGGGVGLLYFSVFAAYSFYELFSQGFGLVVMVLITLLAAAVAYRQQSMPLTVLAGIGGYLTPVLLYAGRDQQLALFIYLSILNLAVFLAVAKFYWQELLYTGLLGNVGCFVFWVVIFSKSDNVFASVLFLAITQAIFFVMSSVGFRAALVNQRLPARSEYYLSWFYVVAASFFVFSIYGLLFQEYREVLPYPLVVMAIITMISYATISGLSRVKLNYTLSLSALTMLSLAAVGQFSGQGTNLALLVLGFLWVSVGFLLEKEELRVSGSILMILSLLFALVTPYDIAAYVFLFNPKFGLLFLGVVSLGLVAWLYRQQPPSPSGFEKDTGEITGAIAVMLLWFAFSWEIIMVFRDAPSLNARNLILSLWWIAYGAVLIIGGAIGKNPLLRKLAIVVFGLSILKVFLYDVQSLDVGYRVVSFVVLGIILLSVSYAYHKNKAKITEFLAGEREDSQLNAPS